MLICRSGFCRGAWEGGLRIGSDRRVAMTTVKRGLEGGDKNFMRRSQNLFYGHLSKSGLTTSNVCFLYRIFAVKPGHYY